MPGNSFVSRIFLATFLPFWKKEITQKSIGCKISEYFEKDFYVPNEERRISATFDAVFGIGKKIDILVSRGKIGKATAESIKLRNGIGVV